MLHVSLIPSVARNRASRPARQLESAASNKRQGKIITFEWSTSQSLSRSTSGGTLYATQVYFNDLQFYGNKNDFYIYEEC